MHDRRLSKFLSLILRHQPEKLGVTLDANGWGSVPEIIQKMNGRGDGPGFFLSENKVWLTDLVPPGYIDRVE